MSTSFPFPRSISNTSALFHMSWIKGGFCSVIPNPDPKGSAPVASLLGWGSRGRFSAGVVMKVSEVSPSNNNKHLDNTRMIIANSNTKFAMRWALLIIPHRLIHLIFTRVSGSRYSIIHSLWMRKLQPNVSNLLKVAGIQVTELRKYELDHYAFHLWTIRKKKKSVVGGKTDGNWMLWRPIYLVGWKNGQTISMQGDNEWGNRVGSIQGILPALD